MRNPGEVHIEKLIIHVIDPHRGNFVLSQREVPLVEGDRLSHFFAEHIRNSLRDPVARAAAFTTAEQTTSGICKAMLEGQLDLIGGSRLLAERLCDVVRSRRNISPGVLVVCYYTDSSQPSIARYLGLLKMDLLEVFRNYVEYDEVTGERYVRPKLENDILPTEQERLQKCAFIRPFSSQRIEFNMMMLDRQTRSMEDVGVAKFFIGSFLGAEPQYDDYERTRRAYRALVPWYDEVSKESPDIADHVHEAISLAVHSPAISIPAFLEPLPIKIEQKNKLYEYLEKQKLVDDEFTIDPYFGGKLVRKRYFQGSHGFRLEVSSEEYSQIVHKVEPPANDGTRDYYRIEIHTRDWKEIIKP